MRTGVGGLFDGCDAAESARKFSWLKTGSPIVDRILGGGLREARLVEFYGGSNSGKTQLAMQASLMAAKEGATALYIDTEGKFRPERVEEMAEERGWQSEELLERIVYLRVDSSFEQMDVVRSMGQREKTAKCRLVVVDTITRNFSLELPGAGNVSSRQGALAVHLSQMSRDAFLGRRAYLLTNRVTFGEQHEVGIGGKTLGQMVDSSIRLERDGEGVRAFTLGGEKSGLIRLGRAGLQ